MRKLLDLLRAKEAVLLAHYYVSDEVQRLAELSGGFVGDSLEMASFGQQAVAKRLIVAGVRFMAETSKILSPDKQVFLPDPEASCSLDLGCELPSFIQWKKKYPERLTVVYANTSAAIKAEADWVVTSSIAQAVITHLKQRGEKILWASDRHLGDYLAQQTGADMIIWPGECILHAQFRVETLMQLKQKYPLAQVIAHPECSVKILALADFVGSTSQMLKFVGKSTCKQFIVATDSQIFYKMQQVAGERQLINGCSLSDNQAHRCHTCPWMQRNTLDKIGACLEQGVNEVELDRVLMERARRPLERMLTFKLNRESNNETSELQL